MGHDVAPAYPMTNAPSQAPQSGVQHAILEERPRGQKLRLFDDVVSRMLFLPQKEWNHPMPTQLTLPINTRLTPPPPPKQGSQMRWTPPAH